MTIRSLLQSLFERTGPGEVRTRLGLETLEDRYVPSGIPTVDLTTRGSFGEIDGALFRQSDARPTGTGVINSFVRLQTANAKGTVQQGYNTDNRPLQFDENKSPQFTRSLHLSELPVVNIDGKLYREFLLDINQKSSQPYLSLDELRLFAGGAPNLSGYDPATGKLGGLSALYDMDACGDNWVKLDYRLNSGSGAGDMVLYVSNSLFPQDGSAPYVYLFSRFGVNFAGNAGFEEWAAGTSPLDAANGGISGTVYNDTNLNGVRDAGEVGLAGHTVFLDLNQNGMFDSADVYTTTDQDGNYAFFSLPTGELATYTVGVIPADDTWFTTSPEVLMVTLLTSGQQATGIDFGLAQDIRPT